jgi:hypothetical protein
MKIWPDAKIEIIYLQDTFQIPGQISDPGVTPICGPGFKGLMTASGTFPYFTSALV